MRTGKDRRNSNPASKYTTRPLLPPLRRTSREASATTILALVPVLTSTGRGSDIMVPMAIPSFGGILIEVVTMLVVPVLYCALQEQKLKRAANQTVSFSSRTSSLIFPSGA